jgi:hypothetical protein
MAVAENEVVPNDPRVADLHDDPVEDIVLDSVVLDGVLVVVSIEPRSAVDRRLMERRSLTASIP